MNNKTNTIDPEIEFGNKMEKTIETILQSFTHTFFDHFDRGDDMEPIYYSIKLFIEQALKTVQDQTREEIADNIHQYFIEWRHQVDELYEKGRQTRESQVLLDFPTWLEDKLKTTKDISSDEEKK